MYFFLLNITFRSKTKTDNQENWFAADELISDNDRSEKYQEFQLSFMSGSVLIRPYPVQIF